MVVGNYTTLLICIVIPYFSDCSIIERYSQHIGRKDNLTIVENDKSLSFNVKRVYYLYGVTDSESLGTQHPQRVGSVLHCSFRLFYCYA
ncbi:MAG: WxcM-like domain-containing protein [Bacteroidales bacterium]|nr:WxcM-like domain-containing protein [Bacteroidales bacterium]